MNADTVLCRCDKIMARRLPLVYGQYQKVCGGEQRRWRSGENRSFACGLRRCSIFAWTPMTGGIYSNTCTDWLIRRSFLGGADASFCRPVHRDVQRVPAESEAVCFSID
jgi:hypothetical protein